MQKLVGRLTTLDPGASETLKVVTYFDALVSAGAGIDALIRAAAVIAGVTAGVEIRGAVSRRAPDGTRVEGDAPVRSPHRPTPTGEVWLERVGPHQANDEMIVERFALAAELVHTRHQSEGALQVATDGGRPPSERYAALTRLGVAPDTRVRVLALPLDTPVRSSVPIATDAGLVRVVLDRGDVEPPARAGLGVWTPGERLPDSWTSATVALRMSDRAHPIVDASRLGSLLLLARGYDPAAPPEDVQQLASLDERSREVLDALVDADSIRAASVTLRMHHSTLQARLTSLASALGYDPRSAMGRARYIAASLLLRFASPE